MVVGITPATTSTRNEAVEQGGTMGTFTPKANQSLPQVLDGLDTGKVSPTADPVDPQTATNQPAVPRFAPPLEWMERMKPCTSQ